MTNQSEQIMETDLSEYKTLTMIVYALQAAAFLFGITAIIGVIINYVKKDEVAGTWLQSHFKWQIRTFWWSLLGFIIGFITSFILIGFLVYIVTYVWVLYRVIKGFIKFNDKKEMYKGV